MMQENSGFTALELATTIASVTVIAALLMPSDIRQNKTRRLVRCRGQFDLGPRNGKSKDIECIF
jgi:Tfp pilus assembly protein PilE